MCLHSDVYVPCADPGIFVRVVQVSFLTTFFFFFLVLSLLFRSQTFFCFVFNPQLIFQKSNVFFCFFVFFSPQLIFQKSNDQFQRNLSFFQGSRGVQLFPGGSDCLFPIETHITCDPLSHPPPSGSALACFIPFYFVIQHDHILKQLNFDFFLPPAPLGFGERSGVLFHLF